MGFLANHPQEILGIKINHIAILIAAIYTPFLLIKIKSTPKIYINLTIVFFSILLINVIQIIFNNHFDLLPHLKDSIIYFSIYLIAALSFIKAPQKAIKSIIIISLIASSILILSFIFLGLPSWNRIFYPIYSEGKFSYPSSYSELADPNVIAYFLTFGLGCTLFSTNKKNGSNLFPTQKIIKIIPCIIILCAIILTLSRSGIIASLFLVILKILQGNFKQKIFFLISLLSIILIYNIIPKNDLVSEIIEERLNSESSNSDRQFRLKNTLEIIENHPYIIFFGLGPGYSSHNKIDPHNFYLSLLIDGGIVVFSLTFYMLYLILFNIKKICNHEDYILAKNLVKSFLIISLFYWQFKSYYFLIFLLLSIYQNNKLGKR